MIKYINKRYAVISVALSLFPSVLTGCTSYGFKYKENSNDEIVAEGTISYDYLKKCYYVEIEDQDYDKTEYYITRRSIPIVACEDIKCIYEDIVTGKEIFWGKETDSNCYILIDVSTNRKIINEIKVEDYLYGSDFIKNSYTVEDVKTILDEMKKIEENKKLVKE